jgi:hypothetical protein
MDVILGQTVVRMSSIQGKSHVIEIVFTSRDKWQLIGANFFLSVIASPPSIILIRLWILNNWHITAWALTIAEPSSFIHVKPNSIILKLFVKVIEAHSPHIL